MGDSTGVILTVPFRIVDKGPACRMADETQSECVSRKVGELIDEGFEQDQAVAAASSMCEDSCESKDADVTKEEHDYVFATAEAALQMSEQIASTGAVCSGFHGHTGPDGEIGYMPCSSHEELVTAITEMDSWHDEEEQSKIYDSINFKPTSAMAREAERGLAWRKEFNRGGTAVGVARAGQLKNRENLSPRTVRRMYSYFARHEVDKEGQGWSPGEEGYPSAGRIAWALWGGDPGRSWANARVRSMNAEDEREGRELDTDFNKKDAHAEMEDAPDIEIGQGVLIEGPVSSGVTDRDGDVVEPEAVMAAWEGYKRNPIILHNHQRGGIGRMIDVRMGEWDGIDHPVPIGRALIDESEKAIVNKIRKGIIRAFSIGFIAREGGVERVENDSGSMAHHFSSIDWVETSVVDIPSNPVALFDVLKNREAVLVKSTAPVSFNSPFAVSIFQQESETMTETEIQEVAETKEADLPIEEATVEAPIETKFVSEEEFKSLAQKVDDILEGMMALKEMSSEPVDEESESEEVVALKAELAELRAAKEAADLEAKIAAEVEARVKSIVGEQSSLTPERKPERKSMAVQNVQIKDDAFEALAQERGVSVGAVKGEAWLASLLSTRRN